MEQFAEDREVIESSIRYSERYDSYTCISNDDKFWIIPRARVARYSSEFNLSTVDAVSELVKFADVHEVSKDDSNVFKGMREVIDIVEKEFGETNP